MLKIPGNTRVLVFCVTRWSPLVILEQSWTSLDNTVLMQGIETSVDQQVMRSHPGPSRRVESRPAHHVHARNRDRVPWTWFVSHSVTVSTNAAGMLQFRHTESDGSVLRGIVAFKPTNREHTEVRVDPFAHVAGHATGCDVVITATKPPTLRTRVPREGSVWHAGDRPTPSSGTRARARRTREINSLTMGRSCSRTVDRQNCRSAANADIPLSCHRSNSDPHDRTYAASAFLSELKARRTGSEVALLGRARMGPRKAKGPADPAISADSLHARD